MSSSNRCRGAGPAARRPPAGFPDLDVQSWLMSSFLVGWYHPWVQAGSSVGTSEPGRNHISPKVRIRRVWDRS